MENVDSSDASNSDIEPNSSRHMGSPKTASKKENTKPKLSRGDNSGLKKKSPKSSGHQGRVSSPRRAKPSHSSVLEQQDHSNFESPRRAKGQMSILEGIGNDSENPSKLLSSNKRDSSPAKASPPGKPATPDVGGAKTDIHNKSTVDSKLVKMGNPPVATKPPEQSCWLAGGSSESDWDFEGPMILPPPPI
jgi:hypothetical protein